MTQGLRWCWLLFFFLFFLNGNSSFTTVTNQVSQLLPDDGVHAPDLGRALQNAEGLGEGLGLMCRSQGCPVTTATNNKAGVVQGERNRKRGDGQTHEYNTRKHTGKVQLTLLCTHVYSKSNVSTLGMKQYIDSRNKKTSQHNNTLPCCIVCIIHNP